MREIITRFYYTGCLNGNDKNSYFNIKLKISSRHFWSHKFLYHFNGNKNMALICWTEYVMSVAILNFCCEITLPTRPTKYMFTRHTDRLLSRCGCAHADFTLKNKDDCGLEQVNAVKQPTYGDFFFFGTVCVSGNTGLYGFSPFQHWWWCLNSSNLTTLHWVSHPSLQQKFSWPLWNINIVTIWKENSQ